MAIEVPCEFPPLCCNCRTCNLRKLSSGFNAIWSKSVRQRVGYPTPARFDLPECNATVVDIKVNGDVYVLYQLSENNAGAETEESSGLFDYFVQRRTSAGGLLWEYRIPQAGIGSTFARSGGFLRPNRIDCDGSQVYVVCTLTGSPTMDSPDHLIAIDASTGLKVWGRHDLPNDLRDIACGGAGFYIACGDWPSGTCAPNTSESAWLNLDVFHNVAEFTQPGVFVRSFGVMIYASALVVGAGGVWVGSKHYRTNCFCSTHDIDVAGCICRYSVDDGTLQLVCAGGEWVDNPDKAQNPLLWGYVNRLVISPSGDVVSGNRVERPEDCFSFTLDPTYGYLKSSLDITGRDPPISAYQFDAIAYSGGALSGTAGSLLYREGGTAVRNRGYLTDTNPTYNRTGSYVGLDSDGTDLVAGGSPAGCVINDETTPYLIIPCNASQPRLCGDFNTRGQAIVGCGPEDGVEPTCEAYINVSFTGCFANMQGTIPLRYSRFNSPSSPCPAGDHHWSGTIGAFGYSPWAETGVDCEELVAGVGTGNFSPCCSTYSGRVDVCYNCQEDTWVVRFIIDGTIFVSGVQLIFYATITEQTCGPPGFTFTWNGVYTITGTGASTFQSCCTGLTGCGGFLSADGCGGVIVCCEDPFPEELTATLSAASCAALHGTTIPLAYGGVVSGQHIWSGTFSPGGTCGTLTFQFGIFEGVSCEWTMCIKDGGGSTVWGDCTGGSDQGTISCPFVSASYSAAVPTCIFDLMSCAGTLTALVA